MSFVVVIPARYQSTRLPGKPLADIHGQPMIAWVLNARKQAGASQVIVAVDDEAGCRSRICFRCRCLYDWQSSSVWHRASG